MIITRYRIDLGSYIIVIYSNNTYEVQLGATTAITTRPLVMDLRGRLMRDMKSIELKARKNVYLLALQLIARDVNEQRLQVSYVKPEECFDCQGWFEPTELSDSEYSPRGLAEMVCNECEKNRGDEYFACDGGAPF
jgi:hypothetical protein